MSPFKLVRPNLADKQSFLAGLGELNETTDLRSWIYVDDLLASDLSGATFESYVSTLLEREYNPPTGFVNDTVYWAKCGDEVIGRISLRHELTDYLRKIGGHIGYIVRPSWRGRGVASEMLRQLLETEKAKSIGKLLLTCDETNVASEKTILKNGGAFEKFLEMGQNQPRKKHFWITL